MICLSVLAEGRPPTTYVLDRPAIRLGRSSKNEIAFDKKRDVGVSRVHAVIRRLDGGGWTIEDAGSTHGTFVNDVRVEGVHVLKPREVVALGPEGPHLRVTFDADGEETLATVRRPMAGQFPLALYGEFPRRFQVYQKIGEGGCGEVWRGRPLDSSEWTAIKFLRPELLSQPIQGAGPEASFHLLAARLRREAELLQRLADGGAQGLVRVLEVGGDERDGILFLLMEHVDGESLDQPLVRREKLSDRAVRRHLCQVAETLERAHSLEWTEEATGRAMRGLVHGGVKPGNLIVRRSDERAMLVDFGLAAIEQAASHAAGQEPRLAALKYTAPEVLSNGELTAATDLWGLAVTGYVLLSGGTYPYGGMNMTETLRSIHQRRLTPLEKYRPQVDAALAEFLHAALDADPRQRPATAREWVQRLGPAEG